MTDLMDHDGQEIDLVTARRGTDYEALACVVPLHQLPVTPIGELTLGEDSETPVYPAGVDDDVRGLATLCRPEVQGDHGGPGREGVPGGGLESPAGDVGE